MWWNEEVTLNITCIFGTNKVTIGSLLYVYSLFCNEMDKERQSSCQHLAVIILKAHVCFPVFKCFCSSKGRLEIIRIFLAGKRLNCWMNKAMPCKTELQQNEQLPHYKTRILAKDLLVPVLIQIQHSNEAYSECLTNLNCTVHNVKNKLLLNQ